MTTAYRDTATLCLRCKRFLKGCAALVVTEYVELGEVEIAHVNLCQRCRSELRDVIGRTLRDGGSR